MEVYRLATTDKINNLLKALDSYTPAGRRLSDDDINKCLNNLFELISDESLGNNLVNLSPENKINLINILKTNIGNIKNIKDHKELLGTIAFVLILTSLSSRLGVIALNTLGYRVPSIFNLLSQALDEASLIPAFMSDDLNLLPPTLALVFQIAISCDTLGNPEHKYRNLFATFIPVISLLALDAYSNKTKNSLSYLGSNVLSIVAELIGRLIKNRSDASSAAGSGAPAVELAPPNASDANERYRLHKGVLGVSEKSIPTITLDSFL